MRKIYTTRMLMLLLMLASFISVNAQSDTTARARSIGRMADSISVRVTVPETSKKTQPLLFPLLFPIDKE